MTSTDRVAELHTSGTGVLEDADVLRELCRLLPDAIVGRRWFGAKTRAVRALEVEDVLPLPGAPATMLLLTTVTYDDDGAPDTYLLPLREVRVVEDPTSVLVALRYDDGTSGAVIDACHDRVAMLAMLDLIGNAGRCEGARGIARGIRTAAFDEARGTASLEPSLWRREGSNSSIAYGDRLMLKVFRRPTVGVNPDWELGRFLTESAHFPHTPQTAGAIEYVSSSGEARTFALLQALVSNEGDPRRRFMAGLRDYFATVATSQHAPEDFAVHRHDWNLTGFAPPPLALALFPEALEQARLLGRRTAEMHLALAAAVDDDLRPIPFTREYQESLHAATRRELATVLDLLTRSLALLEDDAATNASRLLGRGDAVFARLDPVRDLQIDALRIRVHGDYHLEQVLVCDGDYVILDFEGEPSKSLAERRVRVSPLKDVAGMLRSFDYAARPVLDEMPHAEGGRLPAACTFWTTWVGAAFLDGYTTTGGATLLPEGREASEALLRNFLLEKAAYEVAYELNNRPGWVGIPLRGVLDQLA